MFNTVPNPIPARMKGLNRAEICDVNFQEFVRGWNGQAAGASRRRTRRSSTAARWTRAASASCSNRS